jgi:N-formylglutamate amidohydrolase
VLEFDGVESPVVVEVPHAGVFVDSETLATLAASGHAIARDADLYVDELYANAPKLGATLLIAHVSRYVCDLNRSRSDVDAITVIGGAAPANPHGLIWRSTTEGSPALLDPPLPYAELERRITRFYDPYHATLARLLERKRERFGFAVLLCAHSMPSRGRLHTFESSESSLRPDIVPGTRQKTTAAASLIDVTDELAKRHGLSLSHDTPYSGGHTTAHYGRPNSGIHAIQLELSRRLYMNEFNLTKTSGFPETQSLCDELVTDLGRVKPGGQ